MNDVCIEECAPAKDYRWFELKKGVNLEDMPRFPLEEFTNGMPARTRGIVVAVYLKKIVDCLQGRVEYDLPRIDDRKNGRRVLDHLPISALLDGPEAGDTSHPIIGAEDSDPSDRPGDMAGKEEGS
jgi:hypothetical protein